MYIELRTRGLRVYPVTFLAGGVLGVAATLLGAMISRRYIYNEVLGEHDWSAATIAITCAFALLFVTSILLATKMSTVALLQAGFGASVGMMLPVAAVVLYTAVWSGEFVAAFLWMLLLLAIIAGMLSAIISLACAVAEYACPTRRRI